MIDSIKFVPADEKILLQKSSETSGTTEVIEAFKQHFEESKTENPDIKHRCRNGSF